MAGYSKKQFHTRDAQSGLYVHNDVSDSTVEADTLRLVNDARQADLNEKIRGDWPSMTSTDGHANINHPGFGSAKQHFPRPTDVGADRVSNDRYGVSEGTPESNPGTKVKSKPSPRDNSKVQR